MIFFGHNKPPPKRGMVILEKPCGGTGIDI